MGRKLDNGGELVGRDNGLNRVRWPDGSTTLVSDDDLGRDAPGPTKHDVERAVSEATARQSESHAKQIDDWSRRLGEANAEIKRLKKIEAASAEKEATTQHAAKIEDGSTKVRKRPKAK